MKYLFRCIFVVVIYGFFFASPTPTPAQNLNNFLLDPRGIQVSPKQEVPFRRHVPSRLTGNLFNPVKGYLEGGEVLLVLDSEILPSTQGNQLWIEVGVIQENNTVSCEGGTTCWVLFGAFPPGNNLSRSEFIELSNFEVIGPMYLDLRKSGG
ncbi:hypothetical protein [Pseudoruegeria sp. HB172150]|uniref:hypothetical protein n=1 Tax=Pseudoruegeria sp. HB172150 TaxID=2721164 RepID=UPI0015521359|nr:hypothetical protein [Pseudoruegeria sp. HB172150]